MVNTSQMIDMSDDSHRTMRLSPRLSSGIVAVVISILFVHYTTEVLYPLRANERLETKENEVKEMEREIQKSETKERKEKKETKEGATKSQEKDKEKSEKNGTKAKLRWRDLEEIKDMEGLEVYRAAWQKKYTEYCQLEQAIADNRRDFQSLGDRLSSATSREAQLALAAEIKALFEQRNEV
jgi:type IV secretory pathway VirB10-like protein